MHPSEPFPHFIDDYLEYLYEVLPGAASRDGVHLHDDLLEDFSRASLEAHARALAGFGRRLRQIDLAHLPDGEQLEHRIVDAHIDARLHELETIRAWERNPQLYAVALGTSLAGQTLFAYAPDTERARRVVSKLRQTPRLVEAARDNVRESAGIFVKIGLETWRGVLMFIEAELPRAFSRLDDLHILGDLADASTEAASAIREYVAYLETDLAPRAKASFRIGADAFEQQLRLDEGISLGADRLLTIANRELHTLQEEFRRVAGTADLEASRAAWRAAKPDHPAAGELVAAAREQVAELEAFVRQHAAVSLPGTAPVSVARAPEFLRWVAARLWAPGPFESRPVRGCYCLADADRAWPPERQEEYLRDLGRPTLWNLTSREVYPGRFLQSQHLRGVASKVRKSTLLAPRSFGDGWAHYAEQVTVDAGFRRGEPAVRLGQLAQGLLQLARAVVGIRLHCEDLSVEQGMRIFRDEAFLEESTARREAERGTFDPMYVAAAFGKLMLARLRDDYVDSQGGKSSLRAFHDTVLGNGSAPFWAHRALLLGGGSGTVLD